jgi:hypothetical protein
LETWKYDKLQHWDEVIETWELQKVAEAFLETFHRMYQVFRNRVVCEQQEAKSRPIPKAEALVDLPPEPEIISENQTELLQKEILANAKKKPEKKPKKSNQNPNGLLFE